MQAVGINVTAPADTQQVQDVQEVNEASQPVQQTETENRNPFPVTAAVLNVSQLCPDSVSPTEQMNLPYNEEVSVRKYCSQVTIDRRKKCLILKPADIPPVMKSQIPWPKP